MDVRFLVAGISSALAIYVIYHIMRLPQSETSNLVNGWSELTAQIARHRPIPDAMRGRRAEQAFAKILELMRAELRPMWPTEMIELAKIKVHALLAASAI
jgi:hypothetical protein